MAERQPTEAVRQNPAAFAAWQAATTDQRRRDIERTARQIAEATNPRKLDLVEDYHRALAPAGEPGIGHNMPPPNDQIRIDIPPVRVVYDWYGESIDDYPDRYRETIVENVKIKPCCRKPEHLICSTHMTPFCQAEYPYDLFVAQCRECGCNHYRLLVGDVQVFKHECVRDARPKASAA